MTQRDRSPIGAPCWVDLWTSDVEASRSFYSDLFGWVPEEPSAEFGGYFMFSRNGAPIAGGMGDMAPGMEANNTWKIYLASSDIEACVERAEQNGAAVAVSPMAVADMGTQSVVTDTVGAAVGIWQPGTFQGFSVLGEPGAPSWFELHTLDFDKAVDFYTAVFKMSARVVSGSDEFRYAMLSDESGEHEVAGIIDASGFLSAGTPSQWYVYWGTEDVDAVTSRATSLGGSVLFEPQTTPYGRVATIADVTGSVLKLHARS